MDNSLNVFGENQPVSFRLFSEGGQFLSAYSAKTESFILQIWQRWPNKSYIYFLQQLASPLKGDTTIKNGVWVKN
jgi:hypothetical protein